MPAKAKTKFTPQELQDILDRIVRGDSQAEICRELNIRPNSLSDALSADEDITLRSARARLMSAESWMDRGLDPLEKSLDKDSNIDPVAARAYEQACRQRAAIRNPAYREKHDVSADVRVTGLASVLSSMPVDDK